MISDDIQGISRLGQITCRGFDELVRGFHVSFHLAVAHQSLSFVHPTALLRAGSVLAAL